MNNRHYVSICTKRVSRFLKAESEGRGVLPLLGCEKDDECVKSFIYSTPWKAFIRSEVHLIVIRMEVDSI